jgi:hypothetical protein
MLKKTECWSLCFKDDVVLRYCSFNNLKRCNPNWQLAINVNKTKSMIFKQNYTKTEPSFVYYLFLALYKDIKVSKYVTSELYVIIGLTNVSKRLLTTFTGKLFNLSLF